MTEGARLVMVVEDDAKIARLVCDYLAAAGFATMHLADGGGVADAVARHVPALLLLDLMLPTLDGLEACRAVRQFSAVPIIMVTARVEEIDRLLGLEVGADDYVCKPFSPRELVARVRAQIRRAEGRLAAPAGRDGIVIDEAAQRIRIDEVAVALTPVEFRLLRALLSQPGRVYSRAQLLDLVHDTLRDVSDRAIDSHVKNLRRKLGGTRLGEACIGSVYGVGYRYDPPG